MQFQADVLGVPVVRPQVTETTALGAAYLAGLATGFWASPENCVRNAKALSLRAEDGCAEKPPQSRRGEVAVGAVEASEKAGVS